MLTTTAAVLAAALVPTTPTASSCPPSPATRLDPAAFTRRVDNPWFPLLPGSVWRYRGTKDGRRADEVVRATRRTRTILGVHATVVRDRLSLDGRLAERTTDWYAQDRAGTVWYFGEATATLDRRGRVTSREGSFLAGTHGAHAGIFMPRRPRVGQCFRQELLAGHAEDRFRVASVGRRLLETTETTPLERGVVDGKQYRRSVGTVLEHQLRGAGPPEDLHLVAFHRGR